MAFLKAGAGRVCTRVHSAAGVGGLAVGGAAAVGGHGNHAAAGGGVVTGPAVGIRTGTFTAAGVVSAGAV